MSPEKTDFSLISPPSGGETLPRAFCLQEYPEILHGFCLFRQTDIHFREWVDQGGVTFDYKLRPGPSRTRNALELLGQMGFDRQTVERAREMAARFERGQGWDVLEEKQI